MEIVFHNWTSVGTKCRKQLKNKKKKIGTLIPENQSLKDTWTNDGAQTTFRGLIPDLYLHKMEHVTS